MAITLSILNGFSKLFHCWNRSKCFDSIPACTI